MTLPDRETLSDRLRAKSFGHFIENTNLITDLAGQQKKVVGIAAAIGTAMWEYGKRPENARVVVLIHQRKQELIAAILEDHPDKIQKVRDLLLCPQGEECLAYLRPRL